MAGNSGTVSMAYECPIDLDTERKFEVCDIKWVIENFSLITCGNSWLIQTPIFAVRGYYVTKWLITLGPAFNNLHPNFVVFTLQRCDSENGPARVCVEWKVTISISQKNEDVTIERFSDFSVGSEYKENLKNLQTSIDLVKSFDSDLMTIRCKMIVYNRDASAEFLPSPDRGKSCLSENLLNMFHEGHKCDLRLKFGHKTIMAHKAIACLRIEKFNHLLESSKVVVEAGREIEEIDVPHLSEEATMKIMEYVYSGDLYHVLNEPSLAMLDNVHVLQMYHLKQFYAAKELSLRTTLNVQETRFTWVIGDFFEEYENALASPDLCDELSTTWRLNIVPGKRMHMDYFSVFAENVGGVPVGDICVEFAITDECGGSLYSKLLRRAVGDFRPLRVDKFIRRSTLRSFITGNSLRLTMKLKLPVMQDGANSFVEKHDITVVTNSHKTDSYDLLSRDMQDLLELSDFSDAVLRCNGDRFGIHKSIVSFRCNHLSNLLNDVEDEDTNCSVVKDIEPDVLYLLLNYIYSGVVLQADDEPIVTKLRAAATKFGLPLLESLCDDALKETDNCV